MSELGRKGHHGPPWKRRYYHNAREAGQSCWNVTFETKAVIDFQRYIGIDWSGAGGDDDRVGLRVVEARDGRAPRAVAPPTNPRAKNWKRAEVREFLREALRSDADKTLVGIDAALGYPAGADEAVFGVRGWRGLVAEIAALVSAVGTARETVDRINARHAELPGGPFFSRRTDIIDREWWRETHDSHGFFTETGISYYRFVDTLIPQAISVFYMGPGPMVGGHTITCLATLHSLLEERDEGGDLDFGMWLFEEDWRERKHVIVECYPSILPATPGGDESESRDHLDAVKIAAWMQGLSSGERRALLEIEAEVGEGLRRVVAQEGWVFGVPAPAKRSALMRVWRGR